MDKAVDARQLYSDKVDAYVRFTAGFLSPQAYQAFFKRCEWLRDDMRIMDAGCGTGVATFALLDALRRRGFGHREVNAFDLTPAMLSRFEQRLAQQAIAHVEIRQADVLKLQSLPADWTDYDLVVSVAMLEYIPGAELASALAGLRARLAPDGRLLLVITRKNLITKFLIEKWWQANCYRRSKLVTAFAAAGFGKVAFHRFPYTYFWHNQWAYVIEAGARP